MRLYRNPLSGVTVSLLIILLTGISILTPSRAAAQCAGTIRTAVYDTSYGSTVTAAGNLVSGTYTYPLPKFPVSPQSLLAVVVKSSVTTSATVTIQNNGTSTTLPNVELFRGDGFNSPPVNASSTYVSVPFFGLPLAPGASEVINMNNALNNFPLIYDSVTTGNANFGQFTGSGNVAFTYSDNNVPLPPSGMAITSTTITDQINFSITYYYCDPGTLAEDLLTFTAVRENDQTVLLNWSTANEQDGRKYVVEVSPDGTNYTDTATQNATSTSGDAVYSYTFPTGPAAKGKLYFRLRLEDLNGLVHYSPVRIVDLGNGAATGFSIYPNPPSDFINLTFPGDNQNWQVQVFAADGELVQQNYYPSTNLVHLNFVRKMASGAYFVRAVNPQTNQKYTGSFVIL
jgi:hypothetical protein